MQSGHGRRTQGQGHVQTLLAFCEKGLAEIKLPVLTLSYLWKANPYHGQQDVLEISTNYQLITYFAFCMRQFFSGFPGLSF